MKYTPPRIYVLVRPPPLLLLVAALVALAVVLNTAPAHAHAVQPTVPSNVQVSPGNGSLTLTWSAPSDWRTLTPSGYQIDVAGGSFYGSASPPATSDHADWEKLADVAATATSYTFSGTIFEGGSHEHTVTNGTKYHLRIRAVGTPTNDPSDTHPSYWVVVSGTPQVSVGTPSMIVEPSSLTVPVGSRACYVIYPQTKPTAALRIGAISSDISTATVAGETTSDWNIPQFGRELENRHRRLRHGGGRGLDLDPE